MQERRNIRVVYFSFFLLCLLVFSSFELATGFAIEKEMKNRAWGVVEQVQTNQPFQILRLFMRGDGVFPNNSDHPVLIFKSALSLSQKESDRAITKSGWTSPWAWGIFDYHHYHSTAWELLACVRGQARVQLGGDTGPTVEVGKGDILLIPPGVAHKQLQAKGGFTLLGSYPPGSGHVDTLRGAPSLEEERNICKVEKPEEEPLTKVFLKSLY